MTDHMSTSAETEDGSVLVEVSLVLMLLLGIAFSMLEVSRAMMAVEVANFLSRELANTAVRECSDPAAAEAFQDLRTAIENNSSFRQCVAEFANRGASAINPFYANSGLTVTLFSLNTGSNYVTIFQTGYNCPSRFALRNAMTGVQVTGVHRASAEITYLGEAVPRHLEMLDDRKWIAIGEVCIWSPSYAGSGLSFLGIELENFYNAAIL